MSGIKDLFGLFFWLDNKQRELLEDSLKNKRKFTEDQLHLLKIIEMEKVRNGKHNGGLNGALNGKKMAQDGEGAH